MFRRNSNRRLIRAVTLVATILIPTYSLADEGNSTECPHGNYLPLVPNLLQVEGLVPDGAYPKTNTTVCVDIPVALTKGGKVVWDIDTPVTTDGKPDTTPAGIRHMWMMAIANDAFVGKYNSSHSSDDQLDISNYHIYGVIHGSAVSWALSDTWWKKQVDRLGNHPYPHGNPIGSWIDKIKATAKNTGVDMQLEVCGVALMGKGLSSNEVYPGIKVNQGAFGRFQALHQQGYQLVQEGWVDNDSEYLVNGADN
jgi:intracellular sulfur oxidation DsrE/DsrF family protein